MANNNEKILNLLLLKDNLSPLMDEYLTALQNRYEWSQKARSQFFSIRRKVSEAANEIEKMGKKAERTKERFTNLALEIRREASNLLDDEISNEGQRGLEELSALSIPELTPDYAETMLAYVRKYVQVPKRKLLYLLTRACKNKPTNQDIANNAHEVSQRLRLLIENHMKRSYKEFAAEDFVEELNSILNLMKSLGFAEQAEELAYLTHMDQWQEPKRPDADELIEVIHETRTPTMYINRGYTVLDYVRPVYKSMNYFQRALRERREYVGTKNSYEKLMAALEELNDYYTAHYVQAGGNPRNYHGHHAGEKA